MIPTSSCGGGDLQRPYRITDEGIDPTHPFIAEYRPAASYLYGAEAAVMGIPLEYALSAAGVLNIFGSDHSGNFNLGKVNEDNIRQGYADFNAGYFAPTGSTPSSTMEDIIEWNATNVVHFAPAAWTIAEQNGESAYCISIFTSIRSICGAPNTASI